MRKLVFSWGISVGCLIGSADAEVAQSLNLRGQYGALRTFSAFEPDPIDYQLIQTVEYVQQPSVLGDASSLNPEVDRLRGTLAFQVAPIPFLSTGAFLEFGNVQYRRSAFLPITGQQFSSPQFKSGLHIAGHVDFSRWSDALSERLFALSGTLELEFTAPRRFFSEPILNPTLALSSDLRSYNVPLQAHANVGFRMKARRRYFGDRTVEKHELFSTQGFAQSAVALMVGIELPVHSDVMPYAEYSLRKLKGVAFANSPHLFTIGVKLTPLVLKNLVFLAAVDLSPTPYVDGVPATPFWNAIIGVSFQRFGVRRDARDIPRAEYDGMLNEKSKRQAKLKKLSSDLTLSSLRGLVRDAQTGRPLADVKIELPTHSSSKPSVTGASGRYQQYVAVEGAHEVVISKAGYASIRRPVTFKVGSTVTLDVELRPDSSATQP